MLWYNMALNQDSEVKLRDLAPLVVICHQDAKIVTKNSPCFVGIASKNSANDTLISGQHFGLLDPTEMKESRSEFFEAISASGAGLPTSKIVMHFY
jgi:hypothetical protein